MMSSLTLLVAVAVQHITGTSGNSSLNHFSSLKLGLKSWPHSDIPDGLIVSAVLSLKCIACLLTMCFVNRNPGQFLLLVHNP